MTQSHHTGLLFPPLWHRAICPQEMPAEGEHNRFIAGAAVSTSKQVLGLGPHHLQVQWPESRIAEGSQGTPEVLCGWGGMASLLAVRQKGPVWWTKLSGMTFESLIYC